MPVYIYGVIAVVVIYFIFYGYYIAQSRKKKAAHLQENPDDSLIYPAYGQKGIKSVNVRILSIDDSTQLKTFNEGMHIVFVVKEGKHVIEATAETNRPGVMYKNVQTTYGPLKVEVDVERKKRYALEFDVKTEQFVFKEKGEAK